MLSENKKEYAPRPPKKITPQRLRNIALYYLKRFETSEAALRAVLRRRIDAYARYDKDFDKHEAYEQVEKLLADFVRLKYVDDARFAEIKIRGYLAAGKSPRYILGKLKEKGVDDQLAGRLLDAQEYDPFASAMRLARRKKIGPFSPSGEVRRERRSKDLAVLVRAGFDYDIAVRVLETEPGEEGGELPE